MFEKGLEAIVLIDNSNNLLCILKSKNVSLSQFECPERVSGCIEKQFTE